MVITEILKVKPQLDAAGLNKMETTLNARFARVAKKFSFGLANVIKGGGLVGLALGFIDKLLNPLKETQDAIERMINQGDDIVANAEQFGTTAGKLFKLTKFAEASGLDAAGLNMLLTKYQTSIAEAQADPNKQTAVRAYANDTDIADSFFQFIQSLNKMDRNQQVLVQKEVFGEKQTLKMADFLRQDFSKLQTLTGLRPADAYDKSLNNLGNLNDRLAGLRAGATAEDTLQKGKSITQSMIDSIARTEQRDLARENERIQNFKNLKSISDTMTNVMAVLEQLVNLVGKMLTYVTPGMTEGVDLLRKMLNSRGMKQLPKGE